MIRVAYGLVGVLAVLTGCAGLPGSSAPTASGPVPVETARAHVAETARAHVAASATSGATAAPAASATRPTAPSPAAPAPAPVTPSGSAPVGVGSSPPGTPDASLSPIAAAELTRTGVAATQAPTHLWERIRRGYRMPDVDGDLVRTHEQWYTKRPDYIVRMVERSRKYLFHIVEEVERRGMPSELALLPFIESAFNPQAVSSAKAMGMWQFVPATGKDYQLKQSVFRDDRRDVLASTRAALDYLQRLYGLFGDWHLALAAYNWGEGNVGRSIARSQRAGTGVGYLDISMPIETRNYVPKLQAIKNLVADPQRLGVALPEIANHPFFQTVTVNRDIDVALAARLADIRLEDFQSLNPSHHRPVILASGNPTILVPWDNAEIFERNYQTYNAGPLASWTAWNVTQTMNVADLARQVGMTEAALRTLNAIPPRRLVRAGSVLLVPRGAKSETDVSSQMANNGQLALAPERSAAKGKPSASTRRTGAPARKAANAKLAQKPPAKKANTPAKR